MITKNSTKLIKQLSVIKEDMAIKTKLQDTVDKFKIGLVKPKKID